MTRKKDTPEKSQSYEHETSDETGFWSHMAEMERTAEFLMQAKQRCKLAEELGGEKIVEQSICDLEKNQKFEKLLRLRRFIDELGEKFLNKLVGENGRFQAKDSYQRFQLLQESSNWPEIMERFEKAASYEIKPYKIGVNPATIIFTYPPDKKHPKSRTEEYQLELSFWEKKEKIKKGAEAIIEGIDERKKLSEEEKKLSEEEQEREMERIMAWNEMTVIIEETNPKIRGASTEMTEEDWGKYEQYSLVKPREWIGSLDWSDLDYEQKEIAQELESLLENHPETLDEMWSGKGVQFYVTRRPYIDGQQGGTPTNMVELVYPKGHPKAYETIALFTDEGELLPVDQVYPGGVY